jgi:hypothetical protein
MYEARIPVSSLKGVKVLYENDLYELAILIIRINKTKNEGTNMTTLQTVHGLAFAYANLAGVLGKEVETIMNASGLPSEAAIVDDHL